MPAEGFCPLPFLAQIRSSWRRLGNHRMRWGAMTCCPVGPEVWQPETVSLPLFGPIRPVDFSLPALAVLLGLADGFNPCAMLTLVYFLFMTAWLNAFLLLGYLRPLTLAIGAVDLRLCADPWSPGLRGW